MLGTVEGLVGEADELLFLGGVIRVDGDPQAEGDLELAGIYVEGLPLHDSLSAVTPDNPAMLIHTSGHGVFVNQKAMTLVEMDATTEPPAGGEIVRDASGRPTGMMRESAQDVFRAAFAAHQAQRPAEVNEAEMRRKIKLAGEESLRHGITSFQDLGTTFAEVDLIRTMAQKV